MKYKEFLKWYNDNVSAFQFSSISKLCSEIIEELQAIKWWKRERIWKRDFEEAVIRNIIVPYKINSQKWYFTDDGKNFAVATGSCNIVARIDSEVTGNHSIWY